MHILIADDDTTGRRLLAATLEKVGYDVSAVADGTTALAALQMPQAPKLAILDWMMPEMDGVDVCRAFRTAEPLRNAYFILLTARGAREDIVDGLNAGANDYLTKPFDHEELVARVAVGARVLELQDALAQRVTELEDALADVKRLSGLLPICSYCKSVRDDRNYWQEVESYVARHSEVQFSHGVCPDCYDRIVVPMLDESRPVGTQASAGSGQDGVGNNARSPGDQKCGM